jgi:hypothetical protein
LILKKAISFIYFLLPLKQMLLLCVFYFCRFDYDLNLLVNQHYLENTNAELLRDGFGGLLAYNAVEDQYSSSGRFDSNAAARSRMLPMPVGTFNPHATSSPPGAGTSPIGNTAKFPRQNARPGPGGAAESMRFTHKRPSTAPSAAGGAGVGIGLYGTTTAGAATAAAPALGDRRALRRNLPKNVWSSFDLQNHDSMLPGAGGRSAAGGGLLLGEVDLQFIQQQLARTVAFEPSVTAAFATQMDHTATSMEDADEAENSHFITLRSAFGGSTNAPSNTFELTAGAATTGGLSSYEMNDNEQLRMRTFKSALFDTELLLDLARTKQQEVSSIFSLSFWIDFLCVFCVFVSVDFFVCYFHYFY